MGTLSSCLKSCKSEAEKEEGVGQKVKSNVERMLPVSSCPVQCNNRETESEKEMGMKALSQRQKQNTCSWEGRR